MKFSELRKNAGYKTQESFAKAINSKQSTVAMWESKKRIPKGTTLIQLASFLNVSVDEILKCLMQK